MKKMKLLFSMLTILFGMASLMNILHQYIALPLMSLFMGFTLLTKAKEHYDKGNWQTSLLFIGVTVFVLGVNTFTFII